MGCIREIVTKKERMKTDSIMREKVKVETVAQAFLELLSLRGVDYFFANAGTDFASIVDAFAYRHAQAKELPRPLAIPHEIPLVSMAHGYYLVTGKPQVAMVHVGVGTANSLGALMAANRARVPILFSAGRTPISEMGSPASRSVDIHWGQESFDQAAMLREYVKWDYELRAPTQLETVVDRALAIAMTEPRGPVYLTLPREVLISPLDGVEFQAQLRYDLPTFYPDPEKIQEASALLNKAQFPIVITSSIGRSPSAVDALKNLSETAAIGVISFNPEYMNFPTEHPCHLGFLPDPFLPMADVVLVIDCDVPWYPNRVNPKNSTSIIQAGIDPLYSRYPIRSFHSDLTLQGDSTIVLSEISRVLAKCPGRDERALRTRRKKLQDMHDEMVKSWQDAARNVAHHSPIDFEWVSYNVNRILGDDTVVVNDYDNSMKKYMGQRPGSYFCTPHAGYLGWGIGTALGVKLGLPKGTVIATVGDGSYMLSVPSACHFVSTAYKLPILIIVYNNQCWHAVKRHTLALHPEGWAVRTNYFPLCELEPTAHYEKICEAFGGYGERVETADQVGPAIERALYAVNHEKRQALLNMICKHP